MKYNGLAFRSFVLSIGFIANHFYHSKWIRIHQPGFDLLEKVVCRRAFIYYMNQLINKDKIKYEDSLLLDKKCVCKKRYRNLIFENSYNDYKKKDIFI